MPGLAGVHGRMWAAQGGTRRVSIGADMCSGVGPGR